MSEGRFVLPERVQALGDDASLTIVDDPLATVRPDSVGASQQALRDAISARLKAQRGPHHYDRFTDTLGEGAMGQVLVAKQPHLDRPVAVKVLKDEHKNDTATLRLLQEAWVTGILEHPNIVPVHEIAIDPDGFPQVVLKRIRGKRWSDLMHDPKAIEAHVGATDSFEWNLKTLMTVAGAVQHAHRAGIVHRDIKPQNVMIGAHGDVYLGDWGIAVSLREEDRDRIQLASEIGEMAGTPGYMAPEQVQPEPPVSTYTDVYLLGANLYEIMVGHAPHHGDDLMELVQQVLKSDPPYPTIAPPDLIAIAKRAMAPDPEDRYTSADEVREALQRFLDGRVSARLCFEASATLGDLETLANETTTSSARRRAHLYDLLGACRFGFQQALEEGPQNEVAKNGLERATLAVAHYEMQLGNVDAAERLLLELETPHPELVEELATAKRRATRKQEALEAMRRDQDPSVGQSARGTIMLVVGVLFTISPLIPWIMELEGRRRLLTSAFANAIFLLLCAVLALRKRNEMTASALNRGVIGTLFFVLLAQVVLDGVVFLSGWEPWISSTLRLFLAFVVTGVVVITLEARLWPTTLLYLVGFVVAGIWRSTTYPMLSIANFGLLVNAVVIWWPRRPAARGSSHGSSASLPPPSPR